MDKKKILSRDEMKRISGGFWKEGTLTEEEAYQLYQLYHEWCYPVPYPRDDSEAAAALLDYVSQLEDKYGPSDFADIAPAWPR